MYQLPPFVEANQEAIFSFMSEHPFALLVGSDLAATQTPLLLHRSGDNIVIRGHYMRDTDHYYSFENNPEVLVMFQGPQCYVSAGWYSKRGIGSTWNYMSVQAKATLRFYDDQQTRIFLQELTHHFEDGRPQPELVEHMSDGYINSSLKAIVGFEAELRNVRATFKLSQNRDDASYIRIVRELEAIGKPQELMIVAEMKKRRPHLFEG